MSVRASFETDTVAPTRLNRHQAISQARANTAEHWVNGSQGAAESCFRDRLQAHFASTESDDAAPKAADANTDPEDSSSSVAVVPGGADRVNQHHQAITSDAATTKDIASNGDKKSHMKLFAPAAPQEQVSIIRRDRTANSAVTDNRRQTSCDKWTKESKNIGAPPDVIALLKPVAAVAAPDPNESIGSALITSPVSTQTSSTPSITNTESSIDTPSSSWTSDGWLGAKSEIQPAESSAAWTLLTQGANGALHSEVGTKRVLPDPACTPIGRETGSRQQVDEAAVQDSASSELSPAAGNDYVTGVQGIIHTSKEQSSAVSQLPSKSAIGNQVLAAPIPANGESAQASSVAAALGSVRDVNRSVDSEISLATANSIDFFGSNKTSKLPSPRLTSSESRKQGDKQLLPNSSKTSTFNSPDFSRSAEFTNPGSTPSKIFDAISIDSRMQNTFTALESSARHETSALNWTRAGHPLAEAGYQDPVLGWISVRAEASTGAVHATLVPQSSEAAQVLGGHMAGLHTYLAENRTPVETLTLASFGSDAQQFAGQDSGQGMNQSPGQNAGQESAADPARERQSIARPTTRGAVREVLISDEVFARSSGPNGSDGRHISVLA